MLEEVKVRERKSAKHGKTYEYRFEIAQVGGERKWIFNFAVSKSQSEVMRQPDPKAI